MYIVDTHHTVGEKYTLSLIKVHTHEGIHVTLDAHNDIRVWLTYNGGKVLKLRYFGTEEAANRFIVDFVQSFMSNVQFFYMSDKAKNMFAEAKRKV